MKKTVLLFLFYAQFVFSQNTIRFDFDYAQFKYDSTSNYLEIYYSFIPADFKLVKDDSGLKIKAKMHIQIQNNNTDELIVNKDWGFSQPVKDSAEYRNGKALLGVIGFNLKRGAYNLDISVEDLVNAKSRKDYSERIEVNPLHRTKFAISDIELASRIINENGNKNSIFYKNTLEVFPNPSIIYSEKAPILFYYSELYNLQRYAGVKITLNKKLFNSKNNLVYESSKEISTARESIVEAGIVNLSKYPTDTYTFVLKLNEGNSNNFTSSSKKFFLVNPGVKVVQTNLASADYMSSEFGVLGVEECDDLFEKSKYLAQGFERDEYKKLDSLNTKREFLFKFWKKRDDSPETQLNEFKRLYLSRIETANARYRTMSAPGYKTDRGRVLVLYGEPDEIDRYPNETNTKPYEIWSYNNIEGGVTFVFGDFSGYNYYELIHSTKRGELQDPNWMYRISAN
ncbi:MAG: GWxTD domain-containing protein [Ignavibacteriae bacterium]|nr:GWxTD domain-containing protein [Ignavibacteriota bacterium]